MTAQHWCSRWLSLQAFRESRLVNTYHFCRSWKSLGSNVTHWRTPGHLKWTLGRGWGAEVGRFTTLPTTTRFGDFGVPRVKRHRSERYPTSLEHLTTHVFQPEAPMSFFPVCANSNFCCKKSHRELQNGWRVSKIWIHSVFYIRNIWKAPAAGFLNMWIFEPHMSL